MKKGYRNLLIFGLFGIIAVAFFVVFVLKSEKALVTHPKGAIARSELDLIATNYLLMLIIAVPTLVILFWTAWKYRADQVKLDHDPEHSHGRWGEVVFWLIPTVIILPLAIVLWNKAHELDPYQPLVSDVKPLTVQVVALDWKWLFIYPEQAIATVNFLQIPEQTPIHFELAADGSPMNSFWLPELGGQIYAMTGMITQLHLIADGPGTYMGRAAEINGSGFAKMTFVAKSTSREDFNHWVEEVKGGAVGLTDPVYDELLKPSEDHPIVLYSHVEDDYFQKIVDKYMMH